MNMKMKLVDVCVRGAFSIGENEKFSEPVTSLPLPVISSEPCNPGRMQMLRREYCCSYS